MVDLDTTDDRDNDPLEGLEQFARHAENVQELKEVAAKVDGISDTMRVSYNDDIEYGEVKLGFDFNGEDD